MTDQARGELVTEIEAHPLNQCDGCQAGKPLVNGVHRMGRDGGYPDTMRCQASKYQIQEFEA